MMTRLELLAKIEDLKKMQKDILTLATQLDMAKRHYNEKVKLVFGVCDGQAINIVEFFETVIQLSNLPDGGAHG